MAITVRDVTRLIEIELPRKPSAGATARRLLERQAAALPAGTRLQELKLVVSELVNNAYLHGRGRIELKLDRRPDCLRVEVVDQGENAAVRIPSRPAGDGGHGLRIVAQLASRWGAYQGTTHVWAELRLDPV